MNEWTTHDYPVDKFRTYLTEKGYWNEENEKRWLDESKKNILKAFGAAEKKPKPAWSEMFNDVYATMPEHIK